ncbi:MAG: ATP-binding protein [Bacilli bacterium]|nr:ATP-binding protein [Bacilli bacterium]
MKIVGRQKEIAKLKKLHSSNRFEFVVIKGRRRVGKTFLVDSVFNLKYTFSHTGVSLEELNGDESGVLKMELSFFHQSLKKYGYVSQEPIRSWIDAFAALEALLESKDNGQRMVVFIDELPWLDTPKSDFISAFSFFLNNYASKKSNLLLIVSGSTNSWLESKFSETYGGFYGRKTKEIKLSPLSLLESKELLIDNGFVISDYEMTKLYMAFGGIPYYLSLLDSDYSLAQNIDDLFFAQDATLKNEFNSLFNAIFRNAKKAQDVVRALSTRQSGLTQAEISEKTAIPNGGTLSETLKALISSDIIGEYHPFGERGNVHCYKLIDPFCLFFLRFIERCDTLDPTFFQDNQFSQKVSIYHGFAFENLVYYHIAKVKEALGISGVTSDVAALRVDGEKGEKSTQIDLLIIRKDNVVDMCEIKFYNDAFILKEDYLEHLRNRGALLSSKLKKTQVIENVLISPFGIKRNEYSSYFQKVITLKQLF